MKDIISNLIFHSKKISKNIGTEKIFSLLLKKKISKKFEHEKSSLETPETTFYFCASVKSQS